MAPRHSFCQTSEDNRITAFKKNSFQISGEDFQYQDANMWYKNLDKLIKYMNQTQVSRNFKSFTNYFLNINLKLFSGLPQNQFDVFYTFLLPQGSS